MRLFGLALASALVIGSLVGCGTGGPATMPLTGKVVYDGKPVTGGSLTFAPTGDGAAIAASSPVISQVNPDGTFKVDTGAVLGKHRVLYAPPYRAQVEWDGKGTPPEQPKSPFDGLSPKSEEIDVKAGANDVTIELVAAKPK